MSNENLRLAKQVKNNEFYTQYTDIEKELVHYKDQLKGKIIYCNCDTPESNFVRFFNNVKDEWLIKDVWHTSLDEGISFDSEIAKNLLAKCDIVITNPPFSKVRSDYLPLLISSNKQFLFIGNLNMATMKEIFPLIRDGKMWTGYTHPKEFLQPDGTYKKFGNILWWTNMFVNKPFIFNPDKKYYGNEDKYPHYDNYPDAINVDKISDIPSDYRGILGVPVTIVEHLTPPMTGGGFGLKSLDLEKGQTAKTLEQMTDTTMCDTSYQLLDYDSPHGGDYVQKSIYSSSSGMNTTSVMVKISSNLKSTAKECTNVYSAIAFSLIGITEENGTGLSDGLRTDSTPPHAYIKGNRKYTRMFVKLLA